MHQSIVISIEKLLRTTITVIGYILFLEIFFETVILRARRFFDSWLLWTTYGREVLLPRKTSTTETLEMLKAVYKDTYEILLKKLKCLSGFFVLKVGKCQLTINLALGVLWRPEPTKMLKTFVKSSRKIGEVRSDLEFSTKNFMRRFGDKKGGCKICSTSADSTAKN